MNFAKFNLRLFQVFQTSDNHNRGVGSGWAGCAVAHPDLVGRRGWNLSYFILFANRIEILIDAFFC